MRVIKINPDGYGGPIVLPFTKEGMTAFYEELKEDELGAVWVVKIDEMTQEEFDKLPEHPGW